MSNIQLTKRLLRIASMVPQGTFLADIGTDHAFLPIYLLKNSIIEKGIAADIVDGPLKIAEKNIKAHNLEDRLMVVKSDGLVNVEEYLLKNGFSILDEQVIREEHRFYVIISAKYLEKQKHYFKEDDFNEIFELGAIVPNSCEDARDYLIWKKETLKRNIDALKNSANGEEKTQAFSKIVFEIDRRLKYYA